MRKIADLGLTAVGKKILDNIFGSDLNKEKGIIDSKSPEEFVTTQVMSFDLIEGSMSRSLVFQ